MGVPVESVLLSIGQQLVKRLARFYNLKPYVRTIAMHLNMCAVAQ